jgi:hypothetical protein
MFETRVYISCSYHFGSYGIEEPNAYIFASVDGRGERTMVRGRCI